MERDSDILKIVRESIGSRLSDDEVLGLMHVLYAYEIYLSELFPDNKFHQKLLMDYTQGAVAEVAARIKGDMGIPGVYSPFKWRRLFYSTFGSWYSPPDVYKPLVHQLLEELRGHPWVSHIEQGIAEDL